MLKSTVYLEEGAPPPSGNPDLRRMDGLGGVIYFRKNGAWFRTRITTGYLAKSTMTHDEVLENTKPMPPGTKVHITLE